MAATADKTVSLTPAQRAILQYMRDADMHVRVWIDPLGDVDLIYWRPGNWPWGIKIPHQERDAPDLDDLVELTCAGLVGRVPYAPGGYLLQITEARRRALEQEDGR